MCCGWFFLSFFFHWLGYFNWKSFETFSFNLKKNFMIILRKISHYIYRTGVDYMYIIHLVTLLRVYNCVSKQHFYYTWKVNWRIICFINTSKCILSYEMYIIVTIDQSGLILWSGDYIWIFSISAFCTLCKSTPCLPCMICRIGQVINLIIWNFEDNIIIRHILFESASDSQLMNFETWWLGLETFVRMPFIL